MDEKLSEIGRLYAPLSQEHYSKSDFLSLNAAFDQNFLSVSKNLFTMTVFLTCVFRRKCRETETIQCKKKRESQFSS